jgi:predicted alpha/beta-fold hydrolase
VSTIYAGLIRRVELPQQKRERLLLPDGDFMDLDWSYAPNTSQKLIILLHGLEGHAQRPYITGTAKLFNAEGYDALGVNFRGCSGEPNRLFRSYHSGATEDLAAVVNHVVAKQQYHSIYVKGISLGANMLLKYLGEGQQIPQELKAAIAVSVPCDLRGSSEELHKLKNRAYAIRFLDHLKKSCNPNSHNFQMIFQKVISIVSKLC